MNSKFPLGMSGAQLCFASILSPTPTTPAQGAALLSKHEEPKPRILGITGAFRRYVGSEAPPQTC